MKNFFTTIVSLLAARSDVAPPPDAGDNPNGCASGLYIISARATNELPGIGAMGSIVGRTVLSEIPDSKIIAVDYPATVEDPSYIVSLANGTADVTQLLTNYHNSCPGKKVALIGYSQGAQAIMNTLCGEGGGIFGSTGPIPSSDVTSQVVAVALYGDPSHVANVTFDKGTSIRNGIFARNNTANCLQYANIMVSYCNTGDVFCDSGNNDTVHGQYIQTYWNQTVQFIVDQYHDASKNSPSLTTSNGIATSTTTGNHVSTTSKSGVAPRTKIASKPLCLLLAIALLALP